MLKISFLFVFSLQSKNDLQKYITNDSGKSGIQNTPEYDALINISRNVGAALYTLWGRKVVNALSSCDGEPFQ